MAAAAALAKDCAALLKSIHTLKLTHEQIDPGGNTALTARLRDIENIASFLVGVEFTQLHEADWILFLLAYRALTQDIEDNTRRLQIAWQRSPYQSSNNSHGGSPSEDDVVAQVKSPAQHILSAYAHGLHHFKTALNSYTVSSNSSHHTEELASNGIEARIRANDFLHELFDVGVPRRPRAQHGKTSIKLPPIIRYWTSPYQNHHTLLLQRFEQSHDFALQNERITAQEKTAWCQQHIVYWSAQALDLFNNVIRFFNEHASLCNDPSLWDRAQKYAHRFLIVALRTLWMGQIELDDIPSARSNPILFEISARCLLDTCQNLYRFFNLYTHPWMRDPLQHFERHDSELQIPKIADFMRISQGSSDNSSASVDRAPSYMTSPWPEPSSVVQSYTTSQDVRFTMQPPTTRLNQLDQNITPQVFSINHSNTASILNRHNVVSHDRAQSHEEPLSSGAPDNLGLGIDSLSNGLYDMRLGSFSAPTQAGMMPEVNGGRSGTRPTDGRVPRWNEIQITENGVEHPSTSIGQPFQIGLRTHDREPEFASQWIASKTYVFRSSSGHGGSLRLWTSRTWANGQVCAPHEISYSLPGTEVVPHYAFQSLSNTQHVLYLRCGGTQAGLTFNFAQSGPSDQETRDVLMAFQSALLGATLELEYPVVQVRLKGPSSITVLNPVRMQLWTDDNSWRIPCQKRQRQQNSETPLQMSSRRDRPIPLQDSFDEFEGSKLFMFANGCIFVILITDQIVCDKRTDSTVRLSGTKGSSVKVKILSGSRHSPAGIPLDQAGLGFHDMLSGSFASHKYIEVEFDGPQDIVKEFESDFRTKLRVWSTRSSKPQEFREKERRSRIQGTSQIRRGGSQRH